MDAIRRLRPVLACSVGWMFLATAAVAGSPYAGDCCDVTSGCTPLEECGSGCTTLGSCYCGCESGGPCSCGPGCQCRSGYGSGDERWWQCGSDDDNGLIGASQKCHHGKLWPPYARPHENGGCWTQFHAAHYWPHPYNCWDRSWTKQILAMQAAQGWERATTLCAFHFDPETHCLNDSGRLHLQWILEHAPSPYRTIYVQAASEAAVNAQRQVSIEDESMALTGSHSTPIVVRPVQFAGRPANEVDSIRRAEIESMPRPRIVIESVSTGAGAGM